MTQQMTITAFDQEELEDYIAAHGYPPELAAGEIALAAGGWMNGASYATLASDIVARRHAYEAADAEPGAEASRVWCRICNCTPDEHRHEFGGIE